MGWLSIGAKNKKILLKKGLTAYDIERLIHKYEIYGGVEDLEITIGLGDLSVAIYLPKIKITKLPHNIIIIDLGNNEGTCLFIDSDYKINIHMFYPCNIIENL